VMAMTITDFSRQPTELGRQVAELNRIDTAILAAAKAGLPLPSTTVVFGALSDASIASAEALENCGATSIPLNVRTGLLQLQCSMTDLAISLKFYTGLRHALKLTPKFPEPVARHLQ
jgi:hypothetical protein